MKKVLLLLAEGFEVYEASVFIDVFGWNLVEGDGSTKLFSCGIRKEIESSFNQKFTVDHTIDEVDVNLFDALAVPGGFEAFNFYKDAYDQKFQKIIQEFNNAGKPIASVCVGALALGKSGVLTNRKGTTYNNPQRMGQLKEFGVNVIEQPIVVDDNIISSWNPFTAISVALTLLEMLTSSENAAKVKDLMGF